MSRLLPNTFQTFNSYVDDAMEMLTGEEYKCLSFATRHILGWQDKIDDRCGVISLTMFVKGFKSRDGKVFGGTGLTRPTVQKALDELSRLGFLMKVGKPTPKGQQWQLGDEPDFEVLAARHDALRAKRKDTRKKRTGLAGKPAAASLVGKPVLVYGLYQRWFSAYTRGGLAAKLNQSNGQNHPQNQGQISARKRAGTKLPKPRNPLFDAVAAGHGITDVGAEGGRIAMIANWLAGTYEGKGARRVGKISAPATVEHIQQFFKDWAKANEGVNPPMDFVKFVEHWRIWASRKKQAAAPSSARPSMSATPYSDEWNGKTT